MTFYLDQVLHVFSEAKKGNTVDCPLDNQIVPPKFCEVITAVIKLVKEKKDVTAENIFNLTLDADVVKSYVRLHMMQNLLKELLDERPARKS